MELTLDQIQNFKGKYPKQIWSLFFSGKCGSVSASTECAECSWFFMISQLKFDDEQANLQYGATQAFVYAFTFIGGLFADKILGFRKSLFWGGLLMIVGSLILAMDPHKFFFLGIAFTVVGTGFLNPIFPRWSGNFTNQTTTEPTPDFHFLCGNQPRRASRRLPLYRDRQG